MTGCEVDIRFEPRSQPQMTENGTTAGAAGCRRSLRSKVDLKQTYFTDAVPMGKGLGGLEVETDWLTLRIRGRSLLAAAGLTRGRFKVEGRLYSSPKLRS